MSIDLARSYEGTAHVRPMSLTMNISQNWLPNRNFKPFHDIVDHNCYAWNRLIDQPWKSLSVARRDWAAGGAGPCGPWAGRILLEWMAPQGCFFLVPRALL
jgi:hypothetical protein